MVDIKLTPEQIQTIKRHGEDFKNWSSSEKGIRDIQEHSEHEHYFREKLSPENLNKMTEDEFAEVWKKSWASMMWSNKDWYVKNRLIGPNGVEKIRQGLYHLLYGPEDFVKRYDTFRQNVAGFGVAIISELLNMIFPDKYCLWNNKPKTVLTFLGLDALPDHLFKHNTATGEEYLQCVDYLSLIKNELSQFGIDDFTKLDVFFWHLFEDAMPDQNKQLMQPKEPEERNITNLEDLISTFDKDRSFFGPRVSEEDAMKGRSQFLSDFPADKILEMNIDDYVFGKIDPNTGQTDHSTFCYRLEFGIEGFGGIRGTPANKFGIYSDKATQDYIYDKDKYDSPEAAFNAIKSQIHLILQTGNQLTLDKDWRKFADVLEGGFDIQRHVRSKILSIYYSDEFLQMHSSKDAEHILESLFRLPKEQIDRGLFLKQAKLLELKNAHPVMKEWSNYDFSTFIWRVVNPRQSNETRHLDKESVWLVRAGSKGIGEQQALENNIISVGYGGFEGFDSTKDIKAFRQNFIGLHPKFKIESVNRIVPQIWDFLSNMKKGDFVVLPLLRENSKLVAVGKIEGDYQDNDLRPELFHSEKGAFRSIKWLKKDVPKSEFDADIAKSLGYRGTVYYLGGPVMVDKIKNTLKKSGLSEIDVKDEDLHDNSNRQMETRIPLTIEYLAKTSYIPIETIREIETLLIEKKQIIFYGPPGTSKTYFAKKFAKYFTSDVNNVVIIQFHPSYSYEDFIEGIKPNLSKSGQANGFSKQDGIFKRLVNECDAKPNTKYVLIIDEINRGNIAKIFGELIYLLEYRDEKITLTYSPNEKFSIPSNLYIVGTMNSADRSIAFVDYALRRRFYFKDFYPDSNINLLRDWFKDHPGQIDTEIIIHMLEDINKIIVERLGREYQIGQSYFMKKDLDVDSLKRIIDYAIIPLLDQYFFGKRERLQELKQICNRQFI